MAKDVLFSISIDDKTPFAICAACGSTKSVPPITRSEFIEMDGTIREHKGRWALASLHEVESNGYIDHIDSIATEFYDDLFIDCPGYLPQPSNPADA